MPEYVEKSWSLFPAWLSRLTLQQQAVLMAAVRGQDGDRKTTGFKNIAVALRSSFMKAAHLGRVPAMGEHLASFMSLRLFADQTEWHKAVHEALNEEADSAILHYYTHLMHAAQILAYKHPDEEFRIRWMDCYCQMVEKLHLNIETEEQMDKRLGDWDRDEWDDEDMLHAPAPHGWCCWNAGPDAMFWAMERDVLVHELTSELRPATGFEQYVFKTLGKETPNGYMLEPVR